MFDFRIIMLIFCLKMSDFRMIMLDFRTITIFWLKMFEFRLMPIVWLKVFDFRMITFVFSIIMPDFRMIMSILGLITSGLASPCLYLMNNAWF